MHPRRTRHPKVVAAATALVACTAIGPAAIADRVGAPTAVVRAVPTINYVRSSTMGQTPAVYEISAAVPAEVVQGSTFALQDVVVTGTPDVDLLLHHLTVEIDPPIGATTVDGLSRTIAGPGSLNPPGPFAPAGVPNSTPPLTFTFTATGAVGTTVEFFSGDVSTLVLEIGNPTNTLDVVCTRTSSDSFAATKIVAPVITTTTTAAPTTSTTSTTAPSTTTTTTAPEDPDAARVLGTTAERATPVAASPSFAG
jgi:hypothetical protein